MERRTQSFVEAMLRARENGTGEVSREEIVALLHVDASQLEMATTFTRTEYLEFPALTLDDVMQSLTSCESARKPFYFRVDVFGIPLMGLLAADGLTSLYRLPPEKHFN